jgi:hypothetical protein
MSLTMTTWFMEQFKNSTKYSLDIPIHSRHTGMLPNLGVMILPLKSIFLRNERYK